jgi:AcrR family transcriptional regulator
MIAGMPRLTPEAKIERRRQLIDAARRCLADRSFRSLTVDDVCAEAGVSKGAFYGYFDQKKDLLLALLDDEDAAMRDLMRHLEEAHLSGVERLRGFAQAMVRRGSDPSGLQIQADLWVEMATEPAVRAHWVEAVRERRGALRAWVEDGVTSGELSEIPPNAFAAILLALGDGLPLHAGLDPNGFRWTNVGKALDTLLEGIRRR